MTRDNEKQARKLIKTVENMLSSKDDIIYRVESDVLKSNVISPSTLELRRAYLHIEFFNVSNCEEEVFSRREWMRLGELGFDANTWPQAMELRATVE